MYLNLETTEKRSIQGYSDQEIKVDGISYERSLILSRQEIINDWPLTSILQLDEESLTPLLRYQPKIIIIGHHEPGQFAPLAIIQKLVNQQIGCECMSIGAACRTYNVLLSELRDVVLGIILK